MCTATDYDRIKEQAKAAIDAAGLAAAALPADKRSEALAALKHCIFKYFAEYLYAEKGISPYTYVEEKAETYDAVSTAYYTVCKHLPRRLPAIVEKFDIANAVGETPFFHFWYNCMFFAFQDERIEHARENAHHGVTHVFCEEEEALLRRLLRFLEEEGLTELDAADLKQFIREEHKQHPEHSLSKIAADTIKVWRTNQETFAANLDVYLDKDVDVPVVRDSAIVSPSFLRVLAFLNRLYRSFSDNQRRVVPHKFTADYIHETVREQKQILSKRPPREGGCPSDISDKAFVDLHLDALSLPDRRDYYADGRFRCMVREPFDFTIRERRLRPDYELEEYLGIPKGTAGRIAKSVYRLVAEKFPQNKKG